MGWVNLPPISRARGPLLDLLLDLRVCHRKFGDVSSYRKQMHKEQIWKNRKLWSVFQKIGGISHPLSGARTPSWPSLGPKGMVWKFGDVSAYRNQMYEEQIWKIRKFSAVFQKIGGKAPTPSRARRPPHDLPLDLRVCHGKFGDASYYRDRMHKEQTDRHSSLYIYWVVN